MLTGQPSARPPTPVAVPCDGRRVPPSTVVMVQEVMLTVTGTVVPPTATLKMQVLPRLAAAMVPLTVRRRVQVPIVVCSVEKEGRSEVVPLCTPRVWSARLLASGGRA